MLMLYVINFMFGKEDNGCKELGVWTLGALNHRLFMTTVTLRQQFCDIIIGLVNNSAKYLP